MIGLTLKLFKNEKRINKSIGINYQYIVYYFDNLLPIKIQ